MLANRVRHLLSIAFGTIGVLSILLAALLGYATRSLFDERGFSERIAASLENPEVATFVAERLADAVIKAEPNLIGIRPILVGVGRGVVSSPPFRAAARRSARALHHALFTGTSTRIVLTVQDLGALLQSALSSRPELARKLPPEVSAAIGRLDQMPGGAVSARLVRIGHRARNGSVALLVLGVLLCAASVRLASDRRRAIIRHGVALVTLALLLAILGQFGGRLLSVFARPPALMPAMAGLLGAFLAGLTYWAAALGFAGLVLAAAAASLLERVPLQDWFDHLRSWLTAPQALMRTRFARGLLGAAAGAALIFWPMPSLMVTAWLAGVVVAFAGLREAFVAAFHLMPEIQAKTREARTAPRVSRGQAVLVGAIAALLLAGAGVWLFRSTAVPPPSTEAALLACNGLPELCDRRLDQVVFPGTHNSMGGAGLPGWMFTNQNGDIPRQLEDGIRAFLIDLHYGNPVGGTVKTDLSGESNAMDKYESAVGKEGMEAALRIRDRLAGGKEGPRDIYLCHGFCELGSTRFVPVLREVRSFLVANPGEVLIFDIQDESVTPADVAQCFVESGLVDFVYRGPVGGTWPTLRQMVESDQRVVVMAENHSEGVSWYHPTFTTMQETPYGFRDTTEFSNRPNRGGTSGSLMLMNHWVETVPSPKPTNAEVVNSREFLMRRLDAYARERGRMPNVIAVDFYGIGDLLGVCRELNERPR